MTPIVIAPRAEWQPGGLADRAIPLSSGLLSQQTCFADRVERRETTTALRLDREVDQLAAAMR